ncbi:MAG: hypothetical protein HY660_05395, partial [Armatimonadetes bacterium]|nr:hypothetical protein [Armatimonadota bacterium]
DENTLKDPALEAVLPEAATLTEVQPAVLPPEALPGLWKAPEISVKNVYEYFSGGGVVTTPKEGYEEPVTIPKAERAVVAAAIHLAVKEGLLWLTSGPASVYAEEIPAGLLTEDAFVQAPPPPIPPTDILPESLPEAWTDGATTVLVISVALSKKVGKSLPWATVREAIDGAFRTRLLERTLDSGPWPCDAGGAQAIKVRIPTEAPVPKIISLKDKLAAEAYLGPGQLQDFVEMIADILRAAAGHDPKFRIRIELTGAPEPPGEVIARVNQLLHKVSKDLTIQ